MIFGGPGTPPPLASVNDPFTRLASRSDLPELLTFRARDDADLGYRLYASLTGAPRASVVLVHGSASSGSSMHVLASALAESGYQSYVPDIRGHGASGLRGQIDYGGQLDDDIADFLAATKPAGPTILAGFSAGGGFALRIAGGEQQSLFDGYLLLSPYLSRDFAKTASGDTPGQWVGVGVPRLIALMLINQFGITALNHLPVMTFALDEQGANVLTPQYSFLLAQNFGPNFDFGSDIGNAIRPVKILIGAQDQTIDAARIRDGPTDTSIPVIAIPGIDHVGITTETAASHRQLSG